MRKFRYYRCYINYRKNFKIFLFTFLIKYFFKIWQQSLAFNKIILRTFPTTKLCYYRTKCMTNPGMHLKAHLSTAYHAFGGPLGSAISIRALHRATLSKLSTLSINPASAFRAPHRSSFLTTPTMISSGWFSRSQRVITTIITGVYYQSYFSDHFTSE